jgi:hypothetical protein
MAGVMSVAGKTTRLALETRKVRAGAIGDSTSNSTSSLFAIFPVLASLVDGTAGEAKGAIRASGVAGQPMTRMIGVPALTVD